MTNIFTDRIYLLYLIPAAILSLTIHEFSHAFVSYKLGDFTAKYAGRLTLNPFKHLELFGSIMFLIAGVGWAKPVPIDPRYYKNTKTGVMLVSLAGPLSNLLIAFIALSMVYFFSNGVQLGFRNLRLVLLGFLALLYRINVGLAVFNLLPIPPLDGSKILGGLLPARQYYGMLRYQNYFTIGFFLLIFIIPSGVSMILNPMINFVDSILTFIVKMFV